MRRAARARGAVDSGSLPKGVFDVWLPRAIARRPPGERIELWPPPLSMQHHPWRDINAPSPRRGDRPVASDPGREQPTSERRVWATQTPRQCNTAISPRPTEARHFAALRLLVMA